MINGRRNPYRGQTRDTQRPAADQMLFRHLTPRALANAQAFWDAAEHERKLTDRVTAQGTAIAHAEAAAADYDRVTRDDVKEEHASKALENRLRVAFLSRKGATVIEWNDARDGIMAEYLSKHDPRADEQQPQGFSRGF